MSKFNKEGWKNCKFCYVTLALFGFSNLQSSKQQSEYSLMREMDH